MQKKSPSKLNGNQKNIVHLKRVHAPHDKLFKSMLKDREVAKDFLAVHLPQPFKHYCNLSTLRISDTSYIEGDYAEYLSDILYQVEIQGEPGYLYCLIEHISQANPLIPFQVLKYQVSILQQHLSQLPFEKRKNSKLPIVIPLLFYRGKTSPYPYSTDILDCFDSPKLAQQVLAKPYHLIDLSVIPDEALKTHKSAALLELVQKHIHLRDDLAYLFKDWLEKDQLHRLISRHHFEMVIRYLLGEGHIKKIQLLLDVIKTSDIDREYKDVMLTAAHYLRQEGIQQGLQQGVQQGLQQGVQQGLQQGMQQGMSRMNRENAKKMLAKGVADDFVQEITGLPLEVIDRLKAELSSPTRSS